jgi:signal transduction histidine kinase
MQLARWQAVKWFANLFAAPRPEPAQQAARILAMQRHIVLPAKAVVIGLVLYYLYYSRWLVEVATTRGVVLETIQNFFVFYVLINAGVATALLMARRLPLVLIEWIVFTVGLLDGLFLAALTLVTGGFESILFWVFPGLIVINALSIPLATPQIVLNLSLSVFYLGAGIVNANIDDAESPVPDIPPSRRLSVQQKKTSVAPKVVVVEAPVDYPAEPFLLRLTILWLMTACCYGLQVLVEKQRRAEDEAREFAARQDHLRAAGKLAAEIAHQIKNPLGIINNAAFALQRSLPNSKNSVQEQLRIIREEVERSDRILTELMGYAQLAAGKVEKLDVTDELDRAIDKVFPAAAHYRIEVRRDYAENVPPLMMARSHISEIFVNILQNAREALDGKGFIALTAWSGDEDEVLVSIKDNGPGIPPEKLGKIFEPYFTTKEKGTGLGLAIVKHNIEIYEGTVRVESDLGYGTEFILHFPTRTFMRSNK